MAANLLLLCGKMAAGKSTLAQQLARDERAILLVQDDLLASLYPNEIVDIPTFVKFSGRLQRALEPCICALLGHGVSLVLDFPANTRSQRAWFRNLLDLTGIAHELHFLDVSDELCKKQLAQRSRNLPPGSAFTSEAEFEVITSYFQPPSDEEGFNVIVHRRC